MKNLKNYYELLEVHENASLETIQRVYKLLAKKYHPDLQQKENAKEAEEKFKEVAEAYEVLSNEGKRKAYDEKLHASREQGRANTVTPVNPVNYQKKNDSSSNKQNTARPKAKVSSENLNEEACRHAEQQAFNAAMNKVYNDTYERTLRNMGYKVRYKKTFKQTAKHYLSLFIVFAILAVIVYFIWNNDAWRERLLGFIMPWQSD